LTWIGAPCPLRSRFQGGAAMRPIFGKVASLVLAALVLSIAGGHAAEPQRPIVFVHGNGDTAGLWITVLWRFESNGYPRELLHAVDLRYPSARSVDANPQAGVRRPKT
jgi:triacylglycerol lipase